MQSRRSHRGGGPFFVRTLLSIVDCRTTREESHAGLAEDLRVKSPESRSAVQLVGVGDALTDALRSLPILPALVPGSRKELLGEERKRTLRRFVPAVR
jgi:hypothetical protein